MTKHYDNPKYNAAFDRCIDVMTQLMQKYGPQLLEKQSDEPQNKHSNEDHAA